MVQDQVAVAQAAVVLKVLVVVVVRVVVQVIVLAVVGLHLQEVQLPQALQQRLPTPIVTTGPLAMAISNHLSALLQPPRQGLTATVHLHMDLTGLMVTLPTTITCQ